MSAKSTDRIIAQSHTVATQQEQKTVNSAEEKGPHISIKSEPVFSIGQFPVTNSLLLSSLVFVLFLFLVVKFNLDSAKKKKTQFFYFVIFILRTVYTFFESALGEKTSYFFPLIGAFFFFILFQNWSGLVPGAGSLLYNHTPLFRADTADLNTTIALAIVIMVTVQVYGIKYLGINYFKKFINFSNPINFFVGLLEIVSELSRILSFGFRLFGNIFAGEVLLTVVAFLVPVLVSFPFLLLEVFVGLIQAVVFSMLSAVLLKLAIEQHH